MLIFLKIESFLLKLTQKMSCNIYCIEDLHNLKYIGSTKNTLKSRLSGHKSHKKKRKDCSSCRLDLDNCEIYELETCDISHKKEREKYWINNTYCVNTRKLNFDKKKYREYHQYRKSWGGDQRYNNNLLKIDTTLFQ